MLGLFVCLLFFGSSSGSRIVMPWFCLERCNQSESAIDASVKQLGDLHHSFPSCFSRAAFELYNLGPNGQLIRNSNLRDVGPVLRTLGLETYPMISSYPYPPEFLDWMRQLWSNSSAGNALINALRSEANTYGWNGYQVDWEPTATATPQDAINYANFLGTLAKKLAPIRILPTVATWNSIWNLTAIGNAGVFRVLTMSTYATKFNTFQEKLFYTLKYIKKEELGVGLEAMPPDVDDEIAKRVDLILQQGLNEIDIWMAPIPSDWISDLARFCLTPDRRV